MGSSCCGFSSSLEGEQVSSFSKAKRYFRKMNYSKPEEVTKGVNIRRNPITGLYEGFPKEWVENNQIDISVDISKVVTTSHFSTSIRPNPVLPSNIVNKIGLTSQKPTQHNIYPKSSNYIHVGRGPYAGTTNSCNEHNRMY